MKRPLVFFSAFFLLTFVFVTATFAQTLRGRVIDPDARPVAGAEVIVLHGDAVVTTVKTMSDGRFAASDLADGDYHVIAAAPGLTTQPKSVSITKGASVDIELPLAVSAVQESVVVSAAQVDTPLSRTSDSVTVIDGAELQITQTNTVADALRLVPGFSIAASGGPGAITSIFPRGGESNYTLVLVDGIPQNAFGGGFDAGHLDTAGVERIEVVRGPESALYGDGAIGGIVHLVTRQGGPLHGQASFEGGGYGFKRSTASASGSVGDWRWGGSFDKLTSAGDTRTFTLVGQAPRIVTNDDYDRFVGAGSIGWSDRPSRTVRVDVRGDRDIRGYPGPYGSDPLGLYGGIDAISRGHNTSKALGASASFGNTFPGRHRLQFTWSDLKSHYVSPYGASDDETRRVTGRYQFDLQTRGVGISAGAELLRERVDNTFISGQLFQPVPITRVDSGLFIEARPDLGRHAFVTVGARLERIARDALESSPGSRPAFGQDVVWSANPKASAAWFVQESTTHWTKLRASAGTGIKPPTGFEIAYTDNPSLKPERNRSVDMGIEQAVGGSALVADATWFYNRYEDLIVAIGSSLTGASRYKTDNIANARAKGLEAGLRWRSRNGLAARFSWTWLDAEVLGVNGLPSQAPRPFAVGDPLIRRPRQQGFGELTWAHRRSTAFLTIGGRGQMADYEPNYASTVVTNPGYATVAIGGSFTLAPHVELFGRVTNALDRSYEEVFGFPALGRTASIGVRIAAGR